MINISETITNFLKKDWSYINQFDVTFTIPPTLSSKVEQLKYITNDKISENIISVDTPQLSSQNIESFTGDKWYFHNGKTELLRFSITFKDYSYMLLYKAFTTLFEIQKTWYFDDVAIGVDINYLHDGEAGGVYPNIEYNESTISPGLTEGNKSRILKFNKVLIDSVSQVQFSHNTENQIAEFTVQFKAGQFL